MGYKHAEGRVRKENFTKSISAYTQYVFAYRVRFPGFKLKAFRYNPGPFFCVQRAI